MILTDRPAVNHLLAKDTHPQVQADQNFYLIIQNNPISTRNWNIFRSNSARSSAERIALAYKNENILWTDYPAEQLCLALLKTFDVRNNSAGMASITIQTMGLAHQTEEVLLFQGQLLLAKLPLDLASLYEDIRTGSQIAETCHLIRGHRNPQNSRRPD